IFVAKYSPTGTYLWARTFGNGATGFLSSGNAVAVDRSGDVLISGAFSNTVDFGGGPLTSAGTTDVFIAKFSGAGGAHLWSRRAGSYPGAGNSGKGVAADSSGNVIVTGTFSGTADFGTGPVAANGAGIFVAKYSTAGLPLWTRATGGGSDAGN